MRTLLSLLFLTLCAIGGCTTNAATGRSQFHTLSRDEEIAMGSQAMPGMIAEFGGKVPSQPLQEYVANIGRTLASKTEADNPTLPWEFTLLNAPEINAFATPGGKVYIARGLAEQMTNEAQLAAVIGHEIGHVTARHISEQIGRQTGIGLGAALGAAILIGTSSDSNRDTAIAAGTALTIGGQLISLKFSRDQESESDRLGMRYMTLAGYDPRGMEQTMAILARAAGNGAGTDFFATHPDPARRRTDAARLVATQYAATQNNPSYQLFEQRFQAQFLTPLKAIPAAKPSQSRRRGVVDRQLALHDPATWCAHCAPHSN